MSDNGEEAKPLNVIQELDEDHDNISPVPAEPRGPERASSTDAMTNAKGNYESTIE